MPHNTLHMVCNSHIDPVWLWDWEEGAAVTLATFRTAADLCEEFGNLIFCHNEAILYKYVEEYEPALFKRIRRLVRAKQWHIMGGWYLQPDCNMPSGESFVRQILLGKRYFREKFGVDVTTAMNFDPFGHSRGLVQILAKSGYDSYIYCRPGWSDGAAPAPIFDWVGFDGSEIRAVLATAHYNSPPGGAAARTAQWIQTQSYQAHHLQDVPPASPSGGALQRVSLLLWGVGNHGGGPSRRDLGDLAMLIRRSTATKVDHSTPEAFFKDHRRAYPSVPRHDGDLNPWAVGCYTSMIRVKQKHRELENTLYMTEKMAAAASLQKLTEYPRSALREAGCDLAVSEFHDALPGTSIQSVEDATLRILDHGLEILSRVKARAFFALAAGQRRAREGEYPILIYNHHPYRTECVVECELQPNWPHGTDRFLQPALFRKGREIPVQAEKERANINEDHRKRIVFRAVLEPSQMNRFDVRLNLIRRKPAAALKARQGKIRFRSDDMEVVINTRTGFIDRYRVKGVDLVKPNAGRFLVMKDNADPWGMTTRSFRKKAGSFKLLSKAAGTRFSGIAGPALPSVRVIEDGPVRSVVEAIYGYRDSTICQQYKLPKQGTEIELETRVYWNEKDRMLKLSIPTTLRDAVYQGQTAYGTADLPANGDEAVAQKWTAVVSRADNFCLTCINDSTYGSDMARGELRLSLLRSPAHAAHPTGGRRPITKPDRHTTRMDQGERHFRFWLNGGKVAGRLKRIDREALVLNERPMALNFFPAGGGKQPKAGVVLSDQVVQLGVFKYAESNDDLIIRLFEPTGRSRSTTVSIPATGAKRVVELSAFEIKTLRFNRRTRRFVEVNLLEEPVGGASQ